MSKRLVCALILAASTLVMHSARLFAGTPETQAPLTAPHMNDAIYLKTPYISQAVNAKAPVFFNIDFDYDLCRRHYGDNYYKACGRPLGHDGKSADAGIAVTPPVAGQWQWEGDGRLRFTPSAYWKAGTDYTVSFDLDAMDVLPQAVFDGGTRKISVRIRTEDLTVSFPEMAYMQDPDDVNRRLVTARLQSNYPVKPAVLKAAIRMEMEEEAGGALQSEAAPGSFAITPDAGGMESVMAVPIQTLPDRDRYLRILIDSGLEPQYGGAASAETFSERTRIPDLHSYLAISEAAASIMRGEDGTPSQILSFATNVKAKPAAVLPHVSLRLLPAQHPVSGNGDGKGDFYQWGAENEVTPEILAHCETLPLRQMSDEGDYATQFGFPVQAPPGRYLYLEIDAKAPAFGGYTLGKPYRKIVRMPEWPHDIGIMQEGSILSLSGARKLSLHARGTDGLRIEIAHIRTGALQNFISQTQGDIRSPAFRNWHFQKEDIATIAVRDIPMNFESPQAAQYAALDFSPYLKDGQKGLFLIDIAGSYKGDTVGEARQRFVLVTDMGLLVKENADRTRDLFLVSFSSGTPVSEAAVTVLGRNGLSVFEGATDRDGHIALPDFTGYERDRAPVAITAQKGEDYTFIPFDRSDRKLNLSQYDTGGNTIPPEGLSALLFTDRGIYRPGENVHIGALTRSADWAALPAEMPLKLAVTDPRGRTVLEKIMTFPSGGLQELSFETQEESPTGVYYAGLYIGDADTTGSMLGSASFRVEDYQPDRLRIQTAFNREARGWMNPGDLKARVTLTNLYGTPATNRRIAGAMTLNPAVLTFAGFDTYRFYDSYPARPRTVEYDLAPATTDGGGEAVLDLELAGQEQATYSLNLQTQGFEAGSGRGVSAYSTALVSPMDVVIGYETGANTEFLKKGGNYAVRLIALGQDLEKRAVGGLTLELVRRSFVSTLVRHNDGSYAYEATPREKVVSAAPFAIVADGTSLTLPTDGIGTFSYRIRDENKRIVAGIDFAVAGEGQSAQGRDKDAVLDLRIDKQAYGPGETIAISIGAPYTGAGLITIESDHVLAYQWFRTDKPQSIQTIAVPEGFSGKGYVNVSFVRDLNSREIYMSPLSTAVVPFVANTQARTLALSVKAPDRVRPGEPVTLSYRGDARGKAVIYAVDTGILQVARYETPDPVSYFLTDRALQVSTAQMLDLLMPEFDLVRRLSAQGGDAQAETAALGKHLNPFRRKTLAPAVYWSGVVDVDTEEKTIAFTPPGHFNGEMTIMAVAASDTGVGNFEQTVTVQGDIVITPNVPVFMAPGDKAVISATVANTTDKAGDLVLTVKGSGGVSLDAAAKTLALKAHDEQTASFNLTAGDVPGNAELVFEAHLAGFSQSAGATLSIRPPAARETVTTSGYAERGSGTLSLRRDLYEEYAEKQMALSPLPTPYIYSLARYLDNFPYGCSEQITSKAAPQIALFGLPEFARDKDAMAGKIADAVSTLRGRQGYDGGFSYWGTGESADDFISIYALDFLTQAGEKNLPVPDAMTEDALRYVRNAVNSDVVDRDDARTKAYGIYVLTRNGIVTTNEILHLLQYFEDRKDTQWTTDLTAVYIAASYRMMQQSAAAEKTLKAFEAALNPADVTYRGQDWSSPWYNPLVKYARYLTLVSRHFPERMENFDPAIVFTIASYINDSRYNTVSSAYAIEALTDYAAAQDGKISAAGLTVRADGKNVSAAGLSPVYALPYDAKDVRFSGGGMPVFYTVSETGYDRTPPSEPLAMNMEIGRHYFTDKGEPLTGPVAVGDVIEARIGIHAHDNRTISRVAIVDLLPGGFEIEQADDGDTGGMDAVDRREDRIIAFGTVTPYERVFKYRLRAVARGTFAVPAPYAEAMYDITTKARGRAGRITIIDQP